MFPPRNVSAAIFRKNERLMTARCSYFAERVYILLFLIQNISCVCFCVESAKHSAPGGQPRGIREVLDLRKSMCAKIRLLAQSSFVYRVEAQVVEAINDLCNTHCPSNLCVCVIPPQVPRSYLGLSFVYFILLFCSSSCSHEAIHSFF